MKRWQGVLGMVLGLLMILTSLVPVQAKPLACHAGNLNIQIGDCLQDGNRNVTITGLFNGEAGYRGTVTVDGVVKYSEEYTGSATDHNYTIPPEAYASGSSHSVLAVLERKDNHRWTVVDSKPANFTVPECVVPTNTEVPTETPLPTPTDTEVPTGTPTETETATPTETVIPSETPTETATFTETPTETSIPSETPTSTATATETETSIPSETPTETATATNTSTVTNTPVISNTPTATSTNTQTATATNTSTVTHTPTFTSTPVICTAVCVTATPTITPVICTITPTPTSTPYVITVVVTAVATPTPVEQKTGSESAKTTNPGLLFFPGLGFFVVGLAVTLFGKK